MNKTLSDALNVREEQVQSDSLHQALRLYLNRRAGFTPPEQLLANMRAAATDPAELEKAISALSADPEALEAASLAYLSAAWDEDGEQAKIEAALDQARAKAPVIEVSVLAIFGMYAMYLLVTGGKKQEQRTVTRKPDGTFVTVDTVEYHSPVGPLSVVGRLFKSGGGAKE